MSNNKNLINQDFYESITNHYIQYGQEAVTDWELGFLNVYKLCSPVKNKIILDYGCGEGKFSRFLDSKGAKVIGVDVSPSMLEAAKRNGPGNVQYHIIASGDLSCISSASIDCVVINFVLCILSSQEAVLKVLQELYRVLKARGQVIMLNVNWEKSYGKEFVSFKLEQATKPILGQRLFVTLKGCRNFQVEEYFWSQEKYCEFFHKAGFVIKCIEEPLGKSNTSIWIDEQKYPPFFIMEAEKV